MAIFNSFLLPEGIGGDQPTNLTENPNPSDLPREPMASSQLMVQKKCIIIWWALMVQEPMSSERLHGNVGHWISP